jgi:hypothetical protein
MVSAAHEESFPFSTDWDIAASTQYRIAVHPDVNAKNVTIYYIDLAHADHRQALPEGWNNGGMGSRVGAGAWTDLTTRIPFISFGITAIHDGASSGGGMRLAGHGGLAA